MEALILGLLTFFTAGIIIGYKIGYVRGLKKLVKELEKEVERKTIEIIDKAFTGDMWIGHINVNPELLLEW